MKCFGGIYMYILLGLALVILAIFAIVGFISNSRTFGNKILSKKLSLYITVLVIGLLMIIYGVFF